MAILKQYISTVENKCAQNLKKKIKKVLKTIRKIHEKAKNNTY